MQKDHPTHQKIAASGIMAVLIIDALKDAVPVAEALLKGGVDTLELTLRTPVAIEAGREIKAAFPGIHLGYGTVIEPGQVEQVLNSGADFAVAPGCNPEVIREARRLGLPFAPGIMTPSDIEAALSLDCRLLKFFPAESSGGIRHLSSMAAPYQHLGLQFIPLGGIHIDNAKDYLISPLVAAIGGSWLAKRDLIQTQNWLQITQYAQDITNLIRQIRRSLQSGNQNEP